MSNATIAAVFAAAALFAQENEQPAAFKTDVTLVTTPVVVRDAKGIAVGDIPQDVFQVFDNGKQQVVSRFTVQKAPEPSTSSAPSEPPAAVPDRFVAYLIDDLNLTAGNLIPVRNAALRHLRSELGPESRAAIFTTSGQITTPFSKPDTLESALSRLMPRAIQRIRGSCPDIGFYQADLIVNKRDPQALDAAAKEFLACHPSQNPDQAAERARAEDVAAANARQLLAQVEQQSRVGLSALLDTVRRLRAMPGRRTVVMVSPGFLKTDPIQQISAIVQYAIRSNVVINAIDARGLWTPPEPEHSGLDPESDTIKVSYAYSEASAASGVLADLANGSGGRLLQNSNDLEAALRQAAAPPKYVYVIGFSPANLKQDGKYHSIKVSLKGVSGMRVEARKGYFAPGGLDSAELAKQEIQEAVFSRDERNGIGIDVLAQVRTTADLTNKTATQKIAVVTRLDLKTLPLRRTAGMNLNQVRIVSVLFDADGNLVAGKEQEFQLHPKDGDVEKIRNSGMAVRADFETKPGAYLIRTVVREAEGRQLGARNTAVGPGFGSETAELRQPSGTKATSVRRSAAWKPPEGPPPDSEEPEGPVAAGIDHVKIPGGIAALAAMAGMEPTPAAANFFLQYCRRIAEENLAKDPRLRVYLAEIGSLAELAERGSGRITLSLDSESRETTVDALAHFGWTVRQVGEEYFYNSQVSESRGDIRVELRDEAADSARQEIPAALGIDSIGMVNTILAHQAFAIAVPTEDADFLQERLWAKLAAPLPPGGIPELFLRKPQYAKAYSGLAAMGPEAAAALLSGISLRALTDKYADALWCCGESFAVMDGRVAVPGGAGAEQAWEKLAGASPRDPKAFFRAIIQKDQGRLASFYWAVSRGDAARQRFFTLTPARAERFYKWYRDSGEARSSVSKSLPRWRGELFRGLPLDATGGVRFPGGREAWGSDADDDALTGMASLEALVPVARLEELRKAPLDAASVRRIREHYGAWRWLFPYFEKLPALGAEEFAALARFEYAVAGRRLEELNEIAGEWHSLVKLAELGVTSGALDGAEGARAFRRACQAASAPDHREQALAALREMLGGPGDLDEAIPGRLLRLSGDRRAAFNRILELQRIPPLAAARRSPEKTLVALTGLVYAATLRPDSLLVAENPELAAAHRFVEAPSQCGPFCPALPTVESGRAYVAGGFAGFERAVQFIGREKIQPAAVTAARGAARKEDSPAADFQASARLVEVYVASPDEHSASKGDFKILDNGKPAAIGHFENDSAAVSVALLLDASNSMTPAMASLRKSACALASNLRPIDSSAVFGFGETMTELQTWTHEADAAKRAVLSLRTHGATELYDALVRLIYEMDGRTGKKAIVVFTDGDDTASGLSSDQAVRRAKEQGIPIYTVAHGAALTRRLFVERLAAIAKATGGLSFAIREPREIGPVFERISQDLSHGYLLSFSPDEDPGGAWHTLQVTMRGKAVRAREGYYPE